VASCSPHTSRLVRPERPWVVGADGEDAGTGELLCRSPSVRHGCFKDPERTAEVLRNGWVHTGDIVRQDADGNLFFLDRLTDMIRTGGLNVSSQEGERVLQAHPDVILRSGARVGGEELREHCTVSMAGDKVPKAVHLVEHLPLDPQGKLLERELRRLHGR
jgi:acyl-CoA synthetase (AMP-forming)/AMP-acid ligase II